MKILTWYFNKAHQFCVTKKLHTLRLISTAILCGLVVSANFDGPLALLFILVFSFLLGSVFGEIEDRKYWEGYQEGMKDYADGWRQV